MNIHNRPTIVGYEAVQTKLDNLHLLGLISINAKKTSQFKTQCKGDISHAYETAKILFYPTLCKTPDAPLQNELLC